MKLEHTTEGEVELVALFGRLDAAEAPGVRAELDHLLAAGRHSLVFDLNQVNFVDSSGLSVFVNALQKARAMGGDVAILKPMPAVRSIFELTRLHRILRIFDEKDAAVAALGRN